MLRNMVVFAALALVVGTSSALADARSDCVKGVAMIKAQLKKKHPAPVRDQLRKALSGAELEVMEADWSECLDHVSAARKALGG